MLGPGGREVYELRAARQLRGLLLYGSAFATMGTIAGYAAIAAFSGAILFLILALLGFQHARRVREQEAAPAASTTG